MLTFFLIQLLSKWGYLRYFLVNFQPNLPALSSIRCVKEIGMDMTKCSLYKSLQVYVCHFKVNINMYIFHYISVNSCPLKNKSKNVMRNTHWIFINALAYFLCVGLRVYAV